MEKRIIEALLQCPLFAGLSATEIKIALSGTGYKLVDYRKNDVYALAGMPCRYADIVVSGSLVCRMSSLSGKQVEVSRLRTGNMVAPAFIFAKDTSLPVSVETDTAVTLFRMSPAALKSLFDTDEQLRMNFIRTLSNIDVFLTRKMKVLSLFSIREKVASLLMDHVKEEGSHTIHLYRSRQEIADSFGIQKYSLLRVLADLEAAGAIKLNGREITVLDPGKLLMA